MDENNSVKEVLKEPPRYAKAIMAALLAGSGSAAVASVGGFDESEVWAIVATTVAAFVGVFGVRNRA